MLELVNDPQIKRILNPPDASEGWKEDFDKLVNGDISLNRKSAGEDSIKAFQRLLIFLGYSTSSGGSFSIDGDFGRGSNRGLAQFQFDHGLADTTIGRKTLAYECRFSNASKLIKTIPDVTLNIETLEKMLSVAKAAIENNQVNCGDFEEAIFQLNSLQSRTYLDCKQVNERYGKAAEKASKELKVTKGRVVHPEWILAIIKQETSGVVRPKFEQHQLTKLNKETADTPLNELRFRAMSFGLGQIMGFNYKEIGVNSAQELYTLPLEKQIIAIATFLSNRRAVRAVVSKMNPTAEDFRTVAKNYNGPAYATHHYDESIASWFNEFKLIRGGVS